MAINRRTPMTTEERARVSKKVQFMMREERQKPKDERRSQDQIVAIAYDVVRRGEA